MKLGFSEISGPGLIITLADSKQKPKPDDDPNYYIVHDWQIRNLVRFLFGLVRTASRLTISVLFSIQKLCVPVPLS